MFDAIISVKFQRRGSNSPRILVVNTEQSRKHQTAPRSYGRICRAARIPGDPIDKWLTETLS